MKKKKAKSDKMIDLLLQCCVQQLVETAILEIAVNQPIDAVVMEYAEHKNAKEELKRRTNMILAVYEQPVLLVSLSL